MTTSRFSPARRTRAAAIAIGAAAMMVLGVSSCAPSTVIGGGSGPGGSGPGGSGPGGSSTTTSILGTWTLVKGTDDKGSISPDGAVVTLTLNGASSGGQGPCNAYGARSSTATTGPITITVGIRTEMACTEPSRNLTEARYFAALAKIRTASISSNQLALTGGGDTLFFTRSTK